MPPPTVEAVLARALDEPSLARGVLHHAVEPARDAVTAPFPGWLDPRIRAALAARGIDALYTHQAEALEAVRAGRDVCVVTPTASGKSLCYELPVLQALTEDPAARALWLFPTKALGEDQVTAFRELTQAAGLAIATATYDGDTPDADPLVDPDRRPGRGDEPRHAPRGDPPPPHEVVPALRAGPGDRHRRAAHVPRALRQPRRQRHPPAAAALRALRLASGDRHLLGHDRQPGRAGDPPHRAGPRSSSTATGRRAASGTSCSSTRR